MADTDTFTDDEIKKIQEMFKSYDRDDSGKIDAKELATLMRALNQNPTEKEIDEMMKEVDSMEVDGMIDWDEFLGFMTRSKLKESPEDLKEAFKVFDKNGDGVISKDELLKVVTSIGEPMTEKEAKEMIAQADIDKDGFINIDEFCKTLKQ